MNNQQPAIIVVTGIMAAGKSTIAHLLAQRFQRGVHIEADMLQRMIVAGGKWVSHQSQDISVKALFDRMVRREERAYRTWRERHTRGRPAA